MERPRNLGESGRDDRPERDFRSGVQLLDALELSGTRLFPLEATGIKSLDFARHRRHENEYPYISFDIILPVRHVFLHATIV